MDSARSIYLSEQPSNPTNSMHGICAATVKVFFICTFIEHEHITSTYMLILGHDIHMLCDGRSPPPPTRHTISPAHTHLDKIRFSSALGSDQLIEGGEQSSLGVDGPPNDGSVQRLSGAEHQLLRPWRAAHELQRQGAHLKELQDASRFEVDLAKLT
jgi:hypothetical protein